MRFFSIQSILISLMRNSTQGGRLVGSMSVIKARAPIVGGNLGMWSGMLSAFDCAVTGWRQKEDMWNHISAGFLTGGCLAARSQWALLCYLPHTIPARECSMIDLQFVLGGPKAALGSAVACGIFLSVVEGVGVLMSRSFNESTRPQLPPCEDSLTLIASKILMTTCL